MGYKQKHPETCLAKCLMVLVEKLRKKKFLDKYELDLLLFSLKYDKDNIARGHLEKISKDHNLKINWYVDTKIFHDFVKKKKLPKQVSLINKKINLRLIDNLEKPLIIYVDRFHLWEKGSDLYYKYHYPHFIILSKKLGSLYEIIDPDDGKIKKVSGKILSKAISSLRNHLWISPQMMQVL